MRRSALVLAVPLLLCPALGGCSSTPTASGEATVSTSAAQPTPTTGASASTSAASGSGSGGGEITFHGKLSGTMTVLGCDGGVAQLTVVVDGQGQTSAGLIDADDFTFVALDKTAYTLAKGASKPKLSGKTYTVENTKLVSILNDDTVTADGSVTCP